MFKNQTRLCKVCWCVFVWQRAENKEKPQKKSEAPKFDPMIDQIMSDYPLRCD